MFNKSQLQQIKKDISDFFDKMGFIVEIELSVQDETLKIDLKAEEPQILIGEKGKILICLQRILYAILARKFDARVTRFYFDLDINDYKKKKTIYLKEMANQIGDEVALNKQEKVLAPMLAYERRLIHLELSKRENITTESIGSEPERRVVIKPN